MTPMWRLIREQIRQNLWQLVLNVLLFVSIIFISGRGLQATVSRFDFFLFGIYALWPISMSGLGQFNALRIWRMLPFSETSLANLAWCMYVPIPVGFLFVLVLLMDALGFTQSASGPLPIAWPLLFLVLAVLSTGAFTFASASICSKLACKRPIPYRVRFGLDAPVSVVCTVIALALMLYPSPKGWQDLQASHLAGLFLGTLLTLRSYSLRAWLLQPFKFQYAAKPDPPAHNDAPLPRTSIFSALARDLITSTRGTAFLAIGVLAVYCLWSPILTGFGLRSPSVETNIVISFAIAMNAFMLTLFSVSFELIRLLMALKTIRALPLSAGGCAQLLLSYQYGLSLILVPCAAASLSNGDLDRFLTLLFPGFLIFASLCPFTMFIVTRFGSRVFNMLFLNVMIFACLAVFTLPVLGIHLPSLSRLILAAGLLAFGATGALSYFGLRHLIENSSAVYKRKLFPQQFDQGLGR